MHLFHYRKKNVEELLERVSVLDIISTFLQWVSTYIMEGKLDE